MQDIFERVEQGYLRQSANKVARIVYKSLINKNLQCFPIIFS